MAQEKIAKIKRDARQKKIQHSLTSEVSSKENIENRNMRVMALGFLIVISVVIFISALFDATRTDRTSDTLIALFSPVTYWILRIFSRVGPHRNTNVIL